MIADTDPMLANAMAAAAAALAAPAETTPAGVYEAHRCQTGCGRIVTVVLVRIADSDVDLLCDVCYLLMAAAIADAIPETPGGDPAGQLEDAPALFERIDVPAAAPDDGSGNGSPAPAPE